MKIQYQKDRATTGFKRNLLDGLVELLERLRDFLNPEAKRRHPVRVPVPVENERRSVYRAE